MGTLERVKAAPPLDFRKTLVRDEESPIWSVAGDDRWYTVYRQERTWILAVLRVKLEHGIKIRDHDREIETSLHTTRKLAMATATAYEALASEYVNPRWTQVTRMTAAVAVAHGVGGW